MDDLSAASGSFLYVGSTHRPADFSRLGIACTLDASHTEQSPRRFKASARVTEVELVTSGCFDFDDLQRMYEH
jgi:hypothetical protein